MSVRLNTVVTSYSPGRSIAVSPAKIELKATRTTFDVSVIDGETETAVEYQGHGFQRTLLISALQVLAESGSAASEGVICLAIEEPELSQHPIQAQAFARVLRSLAEDRSKKVQITYATHSPYFIEPRHFHQVRRLTRSSEGVPVVTVRAGTVNAIRKQLSGVIKDSSIDRQLDGIITNQLSVALFADRVLLVEGTTESAVFYGIGDRSGPGTLESKGVSIVPCGSKSTIPLFHAILVPWEFPPTPYLMVTAASKRGRSQRERRRQILRQNDVAT